jgi:cobalt-zinc-cadmium efflux system outer membrane protein
LRDAISLTLQHNPELSAASWEVGVREAGIGQAGLLPNPELEFEVEEFGGSGARRGFEEAEISFRLSQVIELGGKRTRRIRAASIEHELSRWNYEVKRLDTLTRLAKIYVELLAAQERVQLAKETEHLSIRFHEAVSERVQAGKAAPLEESRARVTRTTERLKREDADRSLATARKRLAAFWGVNDPVFESATGSLDSISAPPRFENPEILLSRNPEMKRWAVAMEHYTSQVNLEKANRIPDIAVSGGVARFMGDDENAMVMGLSLPLPIFDRNQWNVRRAERELAKAREERRAEEAHVSESLFAGIQELNSAYEQADVLIREVGPVAQTALETAEEGYRAGKFSYMEVLDAQSAYFRVRELTIEALAAYHTAGAELERLCGEPLENLSSSNR